jgi:hypothetical protein
MKSPLHRISALIVLLGVPLTWNDALASEQSTACLALAARVAKVLSLKPDASGRSGYASLIPQGAGARIRLACPVRGGHTLLATFSHPSEYPPAVFYDQLAAAAEVLTGVAPERIRLQAHRCHRAAKRAQGRAHKRAQTARIDCHRTAKSSTFWIGGEGRSPQLSEFTEKSTDRPL